MGGEIYHVAYSRRTGRIRDFKVYLNTDFAKHIIMAPVLDWSLIEFSKRLKEFSQRVSNIAGRVIPCERPYTFYGNTAFITRCNFSDRGVWLGLNDGTAEALLNGGPTKKMIRYDSFGISEDLEPLVLQHMFGEWVDEAPVLIQRPNCMSHQ
jgi:hypothetical protein